MKKLLILLMLAIGHLSANADNNPVANPQAVVTSGNARFTVLTPQMIRIQYSETQSFEDRATFAIINRNLPVPNFTTKEEDGYLYITTDALQLKYKLNSKLAPSQRKPTNLSITFTMNGREIIWYPGKDDALNLKGTTRTLDNCIGDSKRTELENGILSRGGWAIIDESPSTKRGDGSRSFAFDGEYNGVPWVAQPVDPNAYDWYFLGYGHEYKKALGDFIKVAGRIPMPPLYIMGYWYSKYQKYTADQFKELVNDINNNDIPLDVMIFDMDWHRSDKWTGWSWDKTVIPDGKELITWMHDHNLKVALNLHPADGVNNYEDNFQRIRRDMGMDASATNVPWQLENGKFYQTMFKNIIRLRESEGVDFWWLDWQQNLTNPRMDGLGETFWCNHVFYNDMKQQRKDRRAVIYHRWGGLGSHRYPIGFSGDTHSTFGTLAFEPYFTATASNVGFAYWGHDLGGHQYNPRDNNNPELYLRWMQYGVFTPIFRTHASNHSELERRIWVFPNFPLLRETVYLRYSLMPYIYTAARECYDTGIAICRPLYYEYPEENNAYLYEDEYFFGNDILVSPITAPAGSNGLAVRKTWLPEGKWFDVCRNHLIDGNTEITDSYTQEEIPYFYRAGSIIPCNPSMSNLKSRPDTLVLKVIPGKDGKANFYEDENDTEGYQDGLFTNTEISQKRSANQVSLTIAKRTGTFPNMPQQRAYRIEFYGQEKPEVITVNGIEVAEDLWTYDEATKTLTLKVDKTSCDADVNIVLRMTSTAINGTSLMNDEEGTMNNSSFTNHYSLGQGPHTVYDLQGRPATANSQLAIATRQQADGTVVSRKFVR